MTPRKKIIMTGGSGLVGSRLRELLSVSYDVVSYSLQTGVDITKPETLDPIHKESAGSVVLHLAAKADVDGCEKDKELGENGDAWKINVLGTQNIANACTKAGHKMLYISTDFVFDGESTPKNGYTEDSAPNPINWYAQTKYEGEKRVTASACPHAILRIGYPYRKEFEGKLDFVRAILTRLRNGQEVKAVTDHFMTPTFIDDIAQGIEAVIEADGLGIYHIVGSSSLTPFEAASAIAETFSIPNPQITKTTRAEFFQGRAPRPFNLTLRNDKIRGLGVSMKTFQEGLQATKE